MTRVSRARTLDRMAARDEGDPWGEVPVYRPSTDEFEGFTRFVRWLQHQEAFRRVGLAKVSVTTTS
jgi:hypothetical protein